MGNEALIGKTINGCKTSLVNLKGRGYWEDSLSGVNGRIIFKWVLEKQGMMM
jgi:hypothetical protein